VPIPAPTLAGYRLRGLLGQGGFGAVFQAERISDRQLVAIKVARPDQASANERLVLETDVLIAIGAPHVPTVYGHGRFHDGSAYAVMEFIAAPTLAEVLAGQEGPMPLDLFGRCALAILDIVELVHNRGYIHCDLKPENVFVGDAFGVKLFDFGLVRRSGLGQGESTREEAPAGTPEYMSPEQCEGRVDLEVRSDLYALGVIF
jgi:eukaryotic-like serine/threonine-protein kinase